MPKPLITDSQTLNGATYHSGHPIAIYDDGYGPLWISRNSIGINGIVRARTWEDAYGICEDEFFPEADETMEQIVREYGVKREHVKVVADASVLVASGVCGAGERIAKYPEDYPDGKLVPQFVRWETVETPDASAWMDNELFQEAFGFRPNGPNQHDKLNHGIYSKDLNGDCLDVLTAEMLEDIGIMLDILSEHSVMVGNVGEVYSGPDESQAKEKYDAYTVLSQQSTGRASGEPVTWLVNGEILREYSPSVNGEPEDSNA